jgi:hypothetical protein
MPKIFQKNFDITKLTLVSAFDLRRLCTGA